MSAHIITDISRIKPDVSGRFWDLIIDNDITIPPGSITPPSFPVGPTSSVIYSNGVANSFSTTPTLIGLTVSSMTGTTGSIAHLLSSDIKFAADAFQVPLNYFSEILNTLLPITYENGNIDNISVSFQRIGNKVSMYVPFNQLLNYGSISTFNRTISSIPARFTPTYGVDTSDYTDYHNEILSCRQINTTIPGDEYTTGVGCIGSNSTLVIYTDIGRGIPATGSVYVYTHTFNYLLD